MKKYKATYIGRRVENDLVVQRFVRTDNKQEMNFKGVNGVSIGYTYECKEAGIARRPERTDDEFIERKEWYAQELIVKNHLIKKKISKQLHDKSNKNISLIVEAVRPFVSNLSFLETKYFVEAVIEASFKKRGSREKR